MLARREIPTNSSSVFSNFPRKRCFDEFSYLTNGQPRQNPRFLIDAYGSEKRQETSWMNTEEEEFNWEDMIPTPSIGFSSKMPVTVAASPTSLVSRVQPYPPVLPATFETRPSVNVHARRPPIYPSKNPVRNPFESINANSTAVSHGLINRPIPVHEHGVANNGIPKRNLHQLPNQLPGPITSNPPTSGQTPPFQFFPSQDPTASQFSQRTTLPRHAPLPNARPVMPLPMRPLPPAGPHALPQILPHPNPSPNVLSQHPTVGYSNLISSLVAQGVISLANQAPVEVTKSPNQAPAEDFIGLEFDPNILKVRHESVIRALYGDFPRQCTTCGHRFKSQDEHRSHMDWHVTKNRMSKNSKQKPSRKWFVSETMWLKGAETLGVKSAPGFLPTETTEEKREDEELAVPADEDQNTCALCGEPFDVFYSDEAEDWMCRRTVYLNAPNGIATGMDRTQLGPIIHAKCRS